MKAEMIALGLCGALLSASAELLVPSANTLGVLETDVTLEPNKSVNVVLPVPFAAADGSALTLAELIDAQTLQDGDKVRVWTGSQYAIFVWSASDSTSAWIRQNDEPTSSATLAVATPSTEEETALTVPVGHALRFVQDAAEGETAQTRTVRFFGEVPATPVTQLAGKTTALLANPTTAAFPLTGLTGRKGDAVLLLAKDATTGASAPAYAYQWDDTTNEDGTKKGWYRLEMKTVDRNGMKVHTYEAWYDAADCTIPAGGAFWYEATNGVQIPWTGSAATTGSSETK